MRETYVMLGKSLIPMMSNTPEDIQTLLELGEVYETLGCTREAIATYERARQLKPDCLLERARAFLDAHPGPVV
jgi:cytochrome c-type biogenesis protein CcmH/NrfG